MMLLNTKLAAIVAAISFGVGASSGAYLTNKYKNMIFSQQIIDQERQANELLAQEKEKALNIERGLAQERDRLEIEYAKNNQKIRTLNSRYNDAVNAGKRLRDPNSRACSEDRLPSNSGPTSQPNERSGAGVLSAEASRFLLNEASRADQVVNDLALCKAWVKQVKKALIPKP